MRPAFLLLLLAMAGIPSAGPDSRRILGDDPNIAVTRIPLVAGDPGKVRIDALTWLGGARLTSRDRAFGGFSSMFVDGDRLTLLSDAGNIVRFRLDPQWQPHDVRFGDLPAGPGTGWGRPDRDSESIVRDPASGRIWVGFEGASSIWRFDPAFAREEAHRFPREMSNWDGNGGAEAMVRLRDGSFIVLAETTEKHGIRGRVGVRFAGDPTDRRMPAFRFGFRPPDGYDPSDMAELPDGRLLVLVRRVSMWRWFESKLVVLDPAVIRPRASVAGEVVATITTPVTRDNFEALAITREGDATIVWLASDDNLTPGQQTLLMKFRLDLPAQATVQAQERK